MQGGGRSRDDGVLTDIPPTVSSLWDTGLFETAPVCARAGRTTNIDNLFDAHYACRISNGFVGSSHGAPHHASVGTSVTLTGSYFCHQPASEDPLQCQNMGNVQFGSANATATQYTDAMVSVEVTSGAGSVDVTLTVLGHVSNSVRFTVE